LGAAPANVVGGGDIPSAASTAPALISSWLLFACVPPLQAVVSIISLILHNNWAYVWLVTGIAGLLVFSAPQISELAGIYRSRKAAAKIAG
jgi:hypothetical protein